MRSTRCLLVICALMFAGCGGQTAAVVEHNSPNGKVKITVNGERLTSIEAWRVTLKVKAYHFKEEQIAFEIYAADLGPETVKFNWTDEAHCVITFRQQDGTEKKFTLIATPEQVDMLGG